MNEARKTSASYFGGEFEFVKRYLIKNKKMNDTPLIVERPYNAAPGRVWHAITDLEQMRQWYFQIDAFKPEPGFQFQFTAGDGQKEYVHHCRVTEVVPGQKLSYTWAYEGYEGSSEVMWELFGEGETTRLKLTHTGLGSFAEFPVSSFNDGWNHILGNSLKSFVEK